MFDVILSTACLRASSSSVVLVDDVADAVIAMGQGAELAKIDIKSAYRVVPVHLGLRSHWKCLARSCRFLKDYLRNTLQLLSYKNLVKVLAKIWQVHTRFKETLREICQEMSCKNVVKVLVIIWQVHTRFKV